MSATAEMLFNLQKFQILALFTSENTRSVTPAYAFAWDRGIFPVGYESAPWHKPYAEHFQVGEEQMDELLKFLDDTWMARKKITFYELEDHYDISGSYRPGPEWDRGGLIDACHYFRLRGSFDDDFWAGLIGHSDCPSESHGIRTDFTPDHVYFV